MEEFSFLDMFNLMKKFFHSLQVLNYNLDSLPRVTHLSPAHLSTRGYCLPIYHTLTQPIFQIPSSSPIYSAQLHRHTLLQLQVPTHLQHLLPHVSGPYLLNSLPLFPRPPHHLPLPYLLSPFPLLPIQPSLPSHRLVPLPPPKPYRHLRLCLIRWSLVQRLAFLSPKFGLRHPLPPLQT